MDGLGWHSPYQRGCWGGVGVRGPSALKPSSHCCPPRRDNRVRDLAGSEISSAKTQTSTASLQQTFHRTCALLYCAAATGHCSQFLIECSFCSITTKVHVFVFTYIFIILYIFPFMALSRVWVNKDGFERHWGLSVTKHRQHIWLNLSNIFKWLPFDV